MVGQSQLRIVRAVFGCEAWDDMLLFGYFASRRSTGPIEVNKCYLHQIPTYFTLFYELLEFG